MAARSLSHLKKSFLGSCIAPTFLGRYETNRDCPNSSVVEQCVESMTRDNLSQNGSNASLWHAGSLGNCADNISHNVLEGAAQVDCFADVCYRLYYSPVQNVLSLNCAIEFIYIALTSSFESNDTGELINHYLQLCLVTEHGSSENDSTIGACVKQFVWYCFGWGDEESIDDCLKYANAFCYTIQWENTTSDYSDLKSSCFEAAEEAVSYEVIALCTENDYTSVCVSVIL